MKATVVTQITINAPRADVFRYLSHLKYHYLWNPQIQNISSAEALELGTTYQTTSVVLGVKIKAKNVVTKFDSPRELEVENKTGMVQYRANFQLKAQSPTTQLICTTTVSSTSEAFAFVKPVLKALARRELQTDMHALKVAVENHLE